MTRSYRYTVIGVAWILAIIIHYLGIIFFAPGSTVASLADPGVGLYIDANWQAQNYKVFTQYLPILLIGGTTLWGFAAEYDQQSTSRRRY